MANEERAKLLTGNNKVATFRQTLREIDQMWRGKIAEKTLKAREDGILFCNVCAIVELVKRIEDIDAEINRRISVGDTEKPFDINVDINLDSFSKNLTFLKSDPIREKRISVEGKTAMVDVGFWKEFKCPLGHKIVVEVYDYEKEKWEGIEQRGETGERRKPTAEESIRISKKK